MHANDSVMTCNMTIPYIVNILKTIRLSTNIFIEFTSTYYDDINDCYEMLFKQYTETYVNNIDHPVLIQEWKSNLDKAYYEINLKSKFTNAS